MSKLWRCDVCGKYIERGEYRISVDYDVGQRDFCSPRCNTKYWNKELDEGDIKRREGKL